MPRSLRSTLFDNTAITFAVVIAVVGLFMVPRNVDFLNPIGLVVEDLDITDLAFSRFKLEDQLDFDTNIVLVNIGAGGRDEIAAIVERVSLCSPAVVALDVLFERNKDSLVDRRLVNAINQCPNIVVGVRLESSDHQANDHDDITVDGDLTSIHYPFFAIPQHAKAGFCNLVTEGEEYVRTCRETSLLEVIGHDTIPSFALAITTLFNPAAAKRAIERRNATETIHYRGNLSAFYQLDVDDVAQIDSERSFLRNKIVILGYLGDHVGEFDLEDRFYTPLNDQYVGRGLPDMYGAVIHANIVSMLLHEDMITTFTPAKNIALGLLMVIGNVFLFTFLYNRYESWYDLIALSTLLVESIALVWFTIWLFIEYQIKIDPTLTLTGIFLVGPIHDLYHDSIKKLMRQLRIVVLRRARGRASSSYNSTGVAP